MDKQSKASKRSTEPGRSQKKIKILVLNGPNLNLLGTREPEIYGYDTLEKIAKRLKTQAASAGAELNFQQSNSESELVDFIQRAKTAGVDFIIINPAALTHTSRAIPDALSAISIPFLEVHLSNIFAREEFRRHSCFSATAVGVIAGLGAQGYELALAYALSRVEG